MYELFSFNFPLPPEYPVCTFFILCAPPTNHHHTFSNGPSLNFLADGLFNSVCFSQRSKKLLGKTPTHKVARKYLTKSVVLILMLNMQI